MNELQKLESLESQVTQGFASAANALREIKESKIYKYKYGTWENYLKVRWGYNRDWYYKLIEAQKVVENVFHWNTNVAPEDPDRFKVLPPIQNKRQARELAKIKDDIDQIEVWEAVTGRYEPEEITAKVIKQVRQEILEPEIEIIENEYKEEIFNTPEVNFNALEENINPVYDALSVVYKHALKEKVKQSFCEWLSLYVQSFK